MARQQVSAQPSRFEPGIVRGTDERPTSADQPATVAAEPNSLPRAILLDEPIGWMENNVLSMFHEAQLITNPFDIKRLVQHGAKYMVVSQP